MPRNKSSLIYILGVVPVGGRDALQRKRAALSLTPRGQLNSLAAQEFRPISNNFGPIAWASSVLISPNHMLFCFS